MSRFQNLQSFHVLWCFVFVFWLVGLFVCYGWLVGLKIMKTVVFSSFICLTLTGMCTFSVYSHDFPGTSGSSDTLSCLKYCCNFTQVRLKSVVGKKSINSKKQNLFLWDKLTLKECLKFGKNENTARNMSTSRGRTHFWETAYSKRTTWKKSCVSSPDAKATISTDLPKIDKHENTNV